MRTLGVVLTIAATAAVGCTRPTAAGRPVALVAPLGSPAAPGTSRDELARTVTRMEARLAAAPADAEAAVRLADALLRQARVLGNGGLASRAERSLLTVLAKDPERYDARRMLATALLSQHRFRDAIREAERCLQTKPNDPWLYGVLGDGHLELGEYPEAFAAFDRMAVLRPDAASYARISYARELQGDLREALRLMRMALEATGPNDPESQAWHHAQIAGLELALGQLDLAAREYAHAAHLFPDHPSAVEGLARVAHARGRTDEALALLESVVQHQPTAGMLAFAADLLRAAGRDSEAVRYEALAEAAWRSDSPDPAKLAVFLADRRRTAADLNEAVRLAEAASRDRHDIFTADALAWAYYRSGRISEAARASKDALRTGTRDRLIRQHAAAIDRAVHRSAAQ